LRWVPVALAALAFAWVVVLVAAPLLPTPIAAALYAAGSLICHQIPERSFHVQSFQLPVCARCLGLYAGGATGSLAFVAFGPRRWLTSATRRSVLTAAAAMPTIVTIVAEHGFGWPFSNTARALAAVPFAAVIAFAVVSAIAGQAVPGTAEHVAPAAAPPL
jgi:uncharacterized membrane protein